jgi:hypothetical protein
MEERGRRGPCPFLPYATLYHHINDACRVSLRQAARSRQKQILHTHIWAVIEVQFCGSTFYAYHHAGPWLIR